MVCATADLIPLRKAGRLFPSRPDRRTLWRWVRLGVEGPGERMVKLQATTIAGKLYVTPTDVQAFVREQQPGAIQQRG